jgi:hypothetical protein
MSSDPSVRGDHLDRSLSDAELSQRLFRRCLAAVADPLPLLRAVAHEKTEYLALSSTL